MIDDVKKCVDLRINLLDEYFIIPDEIQNEVQAIIENIISLGESCDNAVDFEERFVSEGLLDKYNDIFHKCMPKPAKVTKDQKQESINITKEMLKENRDELVSDAFCQVADRGMNDLRDKVIAETRKTMIKEGTMADYTIAKNYIEDSTRIFGFFKNKLKKK